VLSRRKRHREGSVRACRARGFTLIELLVVIAIISLLVSLMMPSLQKARDLAKRMACSSKLHNIGIAFYLYGQDNDNYFPPAYDMSWSTSLIWAFRIRAADGNTSHPDPKQSSPVKCPSVDNTLVITYGYDWLWKGAYTTDDHPGVVLTNRIDEAERPSECPLVCCAKSYLIWPTRWGFTWHQHPEYLHMGTANVLFVDGHVMPMDQDELEETDLPQPVKWQLYPGQIDNNDRWKAYQ
jgi:prepilin-type N-terminal cleavage/methylation domain-containing protein/prepilin-type processing-associated H-X9-DG protein